MFNWFRRIKPRELIAKAVQEHQRFEAEHVASMEARQQFHKNPHTTEGNRTIRVGDKQLTRRIGQYDRDQKIERILGEVTREYFLKRRNPPWNLRQLVEEAVS